MADNGLGFKDRLMTDEEAAQVCDAAISQWDIDNKKVLVLIPDATRSCPNNLMFRLVYERMADRVAELNYLVALGTHPPMSEEEIYKLVGLTAEEHATKYPKAKFFNHEYKNPDALMVAGKLTKEQVAEVTDGLFEMDVTITCNKMVAEHDIVLIVGPVFPHEVVGFSGGNKYIFPGVAGQEIIDFFHWLGAVITNYAIIGTKKTPVRKVVDEAAKLLDIERKALCLVVEKGGCAGLYYGTPEEAWNSAADLSKELHIEYRDKLFDTVLSCAPPMYDDMWVGGKCMYKIEPIVADGGKVIIYAPHIDEVSYVHGKVLEEIGYHTRDFFMAQWDKYSKFPWGVVAHSTHVKGMGSYEDGVEKPRVEVILATKIPKEVCDKINLGYMDPDTINIEDYADREDEGVLLVRKAGEVLYRKKED